MAQTSDKGWLEEVHWNEFGLIPAIAQENNTGKVLTLAWMNHEALALSVAEGRAIYWSRSRGKLWRKGESSGHIQRLEEIRLDCDNDVILLSVVQEGGIACHTGRHSCFYKRLVDGEWQEIEPILKDPRDIYPEK